MQDRANPSDAAKAQLTFDHAILLLEGPVLCLCPSVGKAHEGREPAFCAGEQPLTTVPCAFQLCRLYKFIEQKGDLQDLTPTVNSLIKQKTGVSQLVKYGLKDLEEVVGLLKKLGVKLQV